MSGGFKMAPILIQKISGRPSIPSCKWLNEDHDRLRDQEPRVAARRGRVALLGTAVDGTDHTVMVGRVHIREPVESRRTLADGTFHPSVRSKHDGRGAQRILRMVHMAQYLRSAIWMARDRVESLEMQSFQGRGVLAAKVVGSGRQDPQTAGCQGRGAR